MKKILFHMKHFKKTPFFYKKPTFLFVSVKRLKLLEKRFCSRYNAERFKNILKARKTIDYC
ncbi:hypothetical protein CUM54_12840 [Enterococcus faecalis]|nr:hypothetical protein CUM54_12840 [Enterococcus faecalis]